MSAILQFVSENALASTLVGAAILAFVGWGIRVVKNHNDSAAIIKFLGASKAETEFTFRSTEAISSNTGIPETRVAALCSEHPKIRRNEKEKQSWRLVE